MTLRLGTHPRLRWRCPPGGSSLPRACACETIPPSSPDCLTPIPCGSTAQPPPTLVPRAPRFSSPARQVTSRGDKWVVTKNISESAWLSSSAFGSIDGTADFKSPAFSTLPITKLFITNNEDVPETITTEDFCFRDSNGAQSALPLRSQFSVGGLLPSRHHVHALPTDQSWMGDLKGKTREWESGGWLNVCLSFTLSGICSQRQRFPSYLIPPSLRCFCLAADDAAVYLPCTYSPGHPFAILRYVLSHCRAPSGD